MKAESKEIKQLIKEADIQAVLESPSIEKEEYQQLANARHNLTEEQKAMKLRYEVERLCGTEDITEENIAFYNKDGKQKTTNMLMFENITEAVRKDKAEIDSGVSRNHRSNHELIARILGLCFKTLNLDEETLQGSFTAKETQQLK